MSKGVCHIHKLNWWTKIFTTFLSLLLSHLHQLLLGSPCYFLGKVIILLETVGYAGGKGCAVDPRHCRCWLIPMEGSGGFHSRVPPGSAQALGKMWELVFYNHPPCNIISPSKFWEHCCFLINNNIVLPFANYNVNEPGRCNKRYIYSWMFKSFSPKFNQCVAFP